MAIIPSFGLIGTVLGWQAVLSSVTFFCGLMMLRALLMGRVDRVLWHLVAAVLIHHLLWRVMSHWSKLVWPQADSAATSVTLPCVAIAGIIIVLKRNVVRESTSLRCGA